MDEYLFKENILIPTVMNMIDYNTMLESLRNTGVPYCYQSSCTQLFIFSFILLYVSPILYQSTPFRSLRRVKWTTCLVKPFSSASIIPEINLSSTRKDVCLSWGLLICDDSTCHLVLAPPKLNGLKRCICSTRIEKQRTWVNVDLYVYK